MGSVNQTARQSTPLIADSAAHNLDFEFPIASGTNNKSVLNGNIAICFTPNKGAGSNSTGLSVSIYPMHKGTDGVLVAGIPGIAVATALDWTDDQLYSYPVTDPIGPCDGIRIAFTYANGTGSEKVTIEAFVSYE